MIQFQLKLTILSSFISPSVPNEGQLTKSLTDELMARFINLAITNYSILYSVVHISKRHPHL